MDLAEQGLPNTKMHTKKKEVAVFYLGLNIKALEAKTTRTPAEDAYLGRLKRELNAHRLGIAA